MRTILFLAAASSGAALLRPPPQATQPPSKEDEEKMHEEFEEKLKTDGAMDILKSSSVASENQKFAKELEKAQEKGKANLKHMTNEKALDMLKSKIPKEKRQEMALILQKAERAESTDKDGNKVVVMKEDEKAMFVKAMKALNDMFLSVDDERIRTLTDCTVDLSNLWRQIFLYWWTIRGLEGSIMEAKALASNARTNGEMTARKIQEENERLSDVKSEQAVAMGAQEKILEGMEADVALYKFIMAQINKQCAEGDKAAYLIQSDLSKKTQKQETCASQFTVNQALLKVFSDKEVVHKAEQDLDAHANHSLKQTLANIHAAEKEEIDPKYSKKGSAFLQKGKTEAEAEYTSESELRKLDQPWKVGDGPGGVCGSFVMDCDALYTIVGQELECNKQKVREQEGVISALAAKQKKERDEINKQITALEKTLEGFMTSEQNYNNEAKGYYEPRFKNYMKLWELWTSTREMRFSCYLRLFELESNYYCAVKHLREYMKGLTLEAFALEESDITDCTADEFMSPTAYCFYPGQIDEHVPCIAGEHLPTDPDLLPKQEWQRQRLTPQIQSEKAIAALNNETIALACPTTMSMLQTCNNFLCPLDCQVTEFGEWSGCTADCDGGMQSRSLQVVRTQRNNGAKCPPTQESRECNTHACDVDCVLHEDWSQTTGCLQACTTGGAPRFELLAKHIKEEAIGNGECPDKHAEGERVITSGKECPPRQCNGDEVCGDVMDLVIAYECSATVTRLGCYFISTFVRELLERMPTVTWGFPSLEVGLVKFGNGISKTEDGGKSYYVNPAVEMSALTSDVKGLWPKLFGDVISLWRGKSNYHLGFNNIGSAMKIAGDILDSSPRTGGDIEASKKIVILTKGKRAGCTVVKSVAEGLKEKGVLIDLILFSPTYETNPKEYEALQETVSYPYHAHIMTVGGLHKIVDYSFRDATAQSFIPQVCPDAFSPRLVYKEQCEGKYAIVHRGRTCANWTVALKKSSPVSLKECRDLALAGEYKGFIWTNIQADPESEDSTEPNCFTHAEQGKADQVNAKGQALESTCTYVPDYGKGQEEKYKGWLPQELAAGSGQVTSHYRVLADSSECGAGMRGRDYLQYKWAPAKYFIK